MEQNTNVSGQQDGGQVQPGQAVSGGNPENIQQGAGQQEQNGFVSRAELAQVLDELKRETQSLVDKNVSRVDRRVEAATRKAEETPETLKAAGMQVSPQQEQQIRTTAVNQALLTSEKPSEQGMPSPAQGQAGQQAHPVDMAADAILQAHGVSLDQNDPEVKLIDGNTTDPNVYLASITKAAAAKKARIEKGGNGAAGVPGAIGSGASSGSLQQAYEKAIANIPRGQSGQMERSKIRADYRKRGLDI